MRQPVSAVPDRQKRVSIHASVKDATDDFFHNKSIFLSFNPRIRKGCDDRIGCRVQGYLSFNPRIRKGCDKDVSRSTSAGVGFNPRIRKGCDLFSKYCNQSLRGFNPRIRKGCDSNTAPNAC